MQEAIMRARRLPKRSDNGPAAIAPANDPADIEAVICDVFMGISVKVSLQFMAQKSKQRILRKKTRNVHLLAGSSLDCWSNPSIGPHQSMRSWNYVHDMLACNWIYRLACFLPNVKSKESTANGAKSSQYYWPKRYLVSENAIYLIDVRELVDTHRIYSWIYTYSRISSVSLKNVSRYKHRWKFPHQLEENSWVWIELWPCGGVDGWRVACKPVMQVKKDLQLVPRMDIWTWRKRAWLAIYIYWFLYQRHWCIVPIQHASFVWLEIKLTHPFSPVFTSKKPGVFSTKWMTSPLFASSSSHQNLVVDSHLPSLVGSVAI